MYYSCRAGAPFLKHMVELRPMYLGFWLGNIFSIFQKVGITLQSILINILNTNIEKYSFERKFPFFLKAMDRKGYFPIKIVKRMRSIF